MRGVEDGVIGVAVADSVAVGRVPVGVTDGVIAVAVGTVPDGDGLTDGVIVAAVGVIVTSLGVSVGAGVRLGGDVIVPDGNGARVRVRSTVGRAVALACCGASAAAALGQS